ncbi:MAG TPA: MBOAT family O-acyltransferase [Actinomycetota bacterium]|nr:MBOAT family O-acyltransferase [Actinomycetota bacterium]
MIFPTIEFATFFVVVLLASWLLMPTPRYWKPFIFVASLGFYAAADWRWVFLLLASIVGNQLAATVISSMSRGRGRKAVLIAALVGNLALLGVFKYLGFFVDSVNGLVRTFGLEGEQQVLELALPVGISFFTFQAISYVVDVYRGRAPLAKPIDTAVYLSFFPHLVAGPIVRATEFIPQLATPRSPRNIPAAPALFLIGGGLIKKVVLADFLAVNLVDPVFGSPQAFGAVDTGVAVLGYAAQIYCDFSGYTDIAIGLAMLLGFWFPQNFDQPYRALSLQEFWHRWHMTLSRWLRDYLYIPLGGSRKGPKRTYINLMLTMVLGGLWHGAAWTFVIWGSLHGAGLGFERWVRERARALRSQPSIDLRDEPPAPVSDGGSATTTMVMVKPRTRIDAAIERSYPKPALWLVTFAFVCFAWVFFRAPDLATAMTVLSRLVVGWTTPATLVTPVVLVALLVAFSTQFTPPRLWDRAAVQFSRLPYWAQGVLFGVFLIVIDTVVGQQGVAPFIYFQF